MPLMTFSMLSSVCFAFGAYFLFDGMQRLFPEKHMLSIVYFGLCEKIRDHFGIIPAFLFGAGFVACLGFCISFVLLSALFVVTTILWTFH